MPNRAKLLKIGNAIKAMIKHTVKTETPSQIIASITSWLLSITTKKTINIINANMNICSV